jgi:hypothetical protein
MEHLWDSNPRTLFYKNRTYEPEGPTNGILS